MLRSTPINGYRSGRARAFTLADPGVKYMRTASGYQSMKRAGLGAVGRQNTNASPKGVAYGSKFALESNAHAFPLLTHMDLGHQDQSSDTRWVQLMNYMPKRAKGTPPWFRGADTYSPLYAEQGRYEYQRYLMIARFPSHFKAHFMNFLRQIRSAGATASCLPQQALVTLQQMIVDNYNPQHVHYLAAMETLIAHNELDMARDCWKIMERQMTWPDDKCVVAYLGLCTRSKEPTWALQCWNRYCTEKQFLSAGEVDPKPVSRIPFTLNRDELIYLPKWKKHFEHDPNLDVTDLNRFNTTRSIYFWMSAAMLAGGETEMFRTLYRTLLEKLLTTPTPVPEPPSRLYATDGPGRWNPTQDQAHIQYTPWGVNRAVRDYGVQPQEHLGHGAASIDFHEPQARFDTNDQAVLRNISTLCKLLVDGTVTPDRVPGGDATKFIDELYDEAKIALGARRYASLQTDAFFAGILHVRRTCSGESGPLLISYMKRLLAEKAALGETGVSERPHPGMYLQCILGLADDGSKGRSGFDPRATLTGLEALVTEMVSADTFTWSADVHLAIMKVLLACGTMKCNEYFVKNVLRQFPWNESFMVVLYQEYRRHEHVDMWAELTKRMLVWTARYAVRYGEEIKRLIEDDYDVIKVQTRSIKELVEFSFRHAAEKKQASDPMNQLPNPVLDYVSHALPFPDRDTGYPNEFGEIGQMRGPASGVKGPIHYAPPMQGEHQRGYTAEWRDNSRQMNAVQLPAPWDRKYKELNRGKHPSYDMVYAGPMPEIFPAKKDFRKPTRWDFHQIESQSKYIMSGPY